MKVLHVIFFSDQTLLECSNDRVIIFCISEEVIFLLLVTICNFCCNSKYLSNQS